MVVFPESGWEIIAKVSLLRSSVSSSLMWGYSTGNGPICSILPPSPMDILIYAIAMSSMPGTYNIHVAKNAISSRPLI